MRPLFVITPILALLACVDARQSCLDAASRDLHIIQDLIEETRDNLRRGYGLRAQTDLIVISEPCPQTKRLNGPLDFCDRVEPIKTEAPIAIDVSAERRKLAALLKKEAEATRASDIKRNTCQQLYPG